MTITGIPCTHHTAFYVSITITQRMPILLHTCHSHLPEGYLPSYLRSIRSELRRAITLEQMRRHTCPLSQIHRFQSDYRNFVTLDYELPCMIFTMKLPLTLCKLCNGPDNLCITSLSIKMFICIILINLKLKTSAQNKHMNSERTK